MSRPPSRLPTTAPSERGPESIKSGVRLYLARLARYPLPLRKQGGLMCNGEMAERLKALPC